MIAERLRAIIFYGKIVNRSELVFRSGYVSKSIQEVTGWPREKVDGALFMELIHPDDRKILDQKWTSFPKTWNAPLRLCKSDGQYMKFRTYIDMTKTDLVGVLLPESHPMA